MSPGKTPISNASSYVEIGEYWDSHDLSDHWDETREVVIQVQLQKDVADEPPAK